MDNHFEEGSGQRREDIALVPRPKLKRRPTQSSDDGQPANKSLKRGVASDEDAMGMSRQKKQKVKGRNQLAKTASAETKKRQAKVKEKRREKKITLRRTIGCQGEEGGRTFWTNFESYSGKSFQHSVVMYYVYFYYFYFLK